MKFAKLSFWVPAIVGAVGLGSAIGLGGTTGALLAIAVVSFILAALFPEMLVYVIIASTIVGQLIRIPLFGQDGALLLNDIAIPILLLAWIIRSAARQSMQFPRASIWIPLLGTVVTMSLSVILARSWYDAGEWVSGALYFVRWIEYAGFFFVAYDLFRALTVREWAFRVLIGSGVVVACLGFLQLKYFPDFTFMVPQGWDPHIGRLLSTWFDPNFLGGWLAMLSGIALALALLRPSRNYGWWTIFAILSLAEVLTFSRSGYLGYVATLFVVTVVRSRALLFIGALGIIGTIFLVPRVQERVLGIRSVDQTAQFRIVSWNNALDIYSEQPFFGVGYNHYKFAQLQRGFITDTSEHSASGSDSSLLTIIVTTGAVGAVFYLWLYASVCWELLRTARAAALTPRARAIGLGSVAALIGLFIHSQFVNGWFYPHIMETTWLLLALTLRERNV